MLQGSRYCYLLVACILAVNWLVRILLVWHPRDVMVAVKLDSPPSLHSIFSPVLERLCESCDSHLCRLAMLNAFNYAQHVGRFVECLASAFLLSTAHALITGDINTSASHL